MLRLLKVRIGYYGGLGLAACGCLSLMWELVKSNRFGFWYNNLMYSLLFGRNKVLIQPKK